MKIRWLIQIHVKQTGLNTRQFDWWSVKRLIRSGVPNTEVCKKWHWRLVLTVWSKILSNEKWQWMALNNEISESTSCLFYIILKNRLHSLLTTAREGNIFRSICLTMGGICLQRGSLPPKGCLPPGRRGLPLGVLARTPLVLISSSSHCSGQYTSYWNTFLLSTRFSSV